MAAWTSSGLVFIQLLRSVSLCLLPNLRRFPLLLLQVNFMPQSFLFCSSRTLIKKKKIDLLLYSHNDCTISIVQLPGSDPFFLPLYSTIEPIHWPFHPLTFCFVNWFSSKIYIWLFFISSISLVRCFLCLGILFLLFVSNMFAIVCWSMYIMAALNIFHIICISVISIVLASMNNLFSLSLISSYFLILWVIY